MGQDREASEGPPEPRSDQSREWCDSQGSSHPTAEGLGHVSPHYLTFVNPHPVKGLFVFARIAEQIARRRPEIPILVVDSRARGKALEETGLDLSWAKNLFTMANTFDPRKFYRVTKAIVMPSLWNESFGLVAAEAMANGIPVLASNRGALPETLGLKKGGQAPQADGSSDASNAGPRSQSPFFQGDGGMLFDIPSRYTPDTRIVPTAEEVEPWVETILRLWDDEPFYRQQSEKAIAQAAQWHPDRLRPLYVEFFRNVHPRPGPSLVPRAPAAGTAVSVGQVANLPDTRQVGNLPHDVRGTSLSEGSGSVRLDASGNAVDSSDATGLPGGPSRSLLHSEARAPSSVPTFPFAPSTGDGSAVAGGRGKEGGRGPALCSEERDIPPGKPAALTGSAAATVRPRSSSRRPMSRRLCFHTPTWCSRVTA